MWSRPTETEKKLIIAFTPLMTVSCHTTEQGKENKVNREDRNRPPEISV